MPEAFRELLKALLNAPSGMLKQACLVVADTALMQFSVLHVYVKQ